MSSLDSRRALPGTISTYLRPAFELAYRLTGDLDAAGNATADALVAVAVAGLPRGREALLAILRQVIGAAAGVGRKVEIPGELDLAADPHRVRSAVRAAIVAIPLRQRAALVLREAFELPDTEIAEILDLQPVQVAGLLDQARLFLARPSVWRSAGAERLELPRSSALAAAAGSLCARVRAAHHAEIEGGQAPVDEVQAQAHREACADCREHRQLIHRARQLTELATPPLFPESFWDDRYRAVEARWREVSPHGRGGGAGSWLLWAASMALLLALLWWGGEVMWQRMRNVPPVEEDLEHVGESDTAGHLESPVLLDSTAAAAVTSDEWPKTTRMQTYEGAAEAEADTAAGRTAPARGAPIPISSPVATSPRSGAIRRDTGARGATAAPSAEELRRLLSELPEVSPAAGHLRPLTGAPVSEDVAQDLE
jgi:DNA-directed RNA polymerase specialized sigma24 family protein